MKNRCYAKKSRSKRANLTVTDEACQQVVQEARQASSGRLARELEEKSRLLARIQRLEACLQNNGVCVPSL